VNQKHHDNGEKEVNPEKRGPLLYVRDRGSGEAIVDDGGATGDVEREENGDSEHSEREEEGAAAALDEKELRSVSAAVAGDFAASGMPDGDELRGESSGPRHAAQLDEEDDFSVFDCVFRFSGVSLVFAQCLIFNRREILVLELNFFNLF